jgi:hypothetical protein
VFAANKNRNGSPCHLDPVSPPHGASSNAGNRLQTWRIAAHMECAIVKTWHERVLQLVGWAGPNNSSPQINLRVMKT